jgi:hypothetical protein
MNSDCYDHYVKIKHCVLVKETPKAIRIRLENHPEKICVWMPKSVIRDFTGKTGWGAFSSHVPTPDGNIVVMFAPHVGIDRDGVVGRIHRDGLA